MIRNKVARMSILTTLVQDEVPASTVRWGDKVYRMKREIKLFLLACAMVVCVENAKIAVKRPVELISELSNITDVRLTNKNLFLY